jgi:Ras-related protein Rab-6A
MKDKSTIKLQLWDTAGHERFKSLIPTYIRESSLAVIVYDITKPDSFKSVDQWIKLVREIRGDDIIVVIAGNKTDLESSRAVKKEELQEKASSLKVSHFYEVSAKSGDNIMNMFSSIVEELISHGQAKKDEIQVIIPPSTEPKKGCKC